MQHQLYPRATLVLPRKRILALPAQAATGGSQSWFSLLREPLTGTAARNTDRSGDWLLCMLPRSSRRSAPLKRHRQKKRGPKATGRRAAYKLLAECSHSWRRVCCRLAAATAKQLIAGAEIGTSTLARTAPLLHAKSKWELGRKAPPRAPLSRSRCALFAESDRDDLV